jgi:site-specific DNA recombinase
MTDSHAAADEPPGTGAPTGDGNRDEVTLLSWLRTVADQNVPEPLGQAMVPVAWVGRTSDEEAQDPTLSLPRQLENSRSRLPDGFVIVAHFYDVESGRNSMDLRGHGHDHEQFDIPIPRDGGIADLLAEAHQPDRRFVAVVCESIDRVARITYFGTKIEYELEQAGVALLAADEGIDPAAVSALADGAVPVKRATPTLTRRVKQAIAEWYVLNMLELSWGGFKAHTDQGYNIGKPPYGYQAERLRHPVKAKAQEGKVKHRLIPDPVRGPAVTQIFTWRALERLSYQQIADRLNTDPDRYPPPDPILGEGRRRVGAWTYGSVREVLDNPKHTGYMVWNRRKNPRPKRGVAGRVNPPSQWVWSQRPTHEPLVTRALFDAASTVGRFRQGSRPESGPNAHPQTARTYPLRSYLLCDLCSRRMYGSTRKTYTYYRCEINERNHAHQPWYPTHPANILVRGDVLLPPVARFFTQRVFGPNRKLLLTDTQPTPHADPELEARRAAVQADLADLQRRQTNLLRELENLQPTGDADLDHAWRSGIQTRFAANVAEQRTKNSLLAELTRQQEDAAPPDLELFDAIPAAAIDITRLPEDKQRRLYDAFHLEVRYHAPRNEVTLRVTIDAETAPALAHTVGTALEIPQPRTAPKTRKAGPAAVTATGPGGNCLRCPAYPAGGTRQIYDHPGRLSGRWWSRGCSPSPDRCPEGRLTGAETRCERRCPVPSSEPRGTGHRAALGPATAVRAGP